MLYKRKIYDKLLDWKRNSNGATALLIEGARRIGKSTIVKSFAENEYENYLLLDFNIEGDDLKEIFKKDIGNMDVFFRNLFLLKDISKLPERKALIIFDEVQRFPLARQAIKYLVQDGRYDYIETGSLISIKQNVKDITIPSEEHKLKMYPFDFEEFLWAQGDNTTALEIRNAFENKVGFGDNINNKLMNKFREYVAVGGMPQAVDAYVKGKTFIEIDNVKREILSLYEDDLKKNDGVNKENASLVFRTIPEQLSNHNSHFKLAKLEKYAKFERYVDAINFINESMIGNECLNVTTLDMALDLFIDDSNFKLYMNDTGLLITRIFQNSSSIDENIYKKIIFNKLSTNEGMIYENVISQMLVANGYNLRFHEFNYSVDGEKVRKYEIDFIIMREGKICPIEVKSSDYKVHKSFDYLKKKYNMKFPQKYIIYTKDLKVEDNIVYIPMYMAMCL